MAPTSPPGTDAAGPPATNELLTGEDFLAGLDDGRAVFFDGERVAKVTEHPAFHNAARTVAHLYDMLHDDAHRDTLTAVDRFGHVTHRFFAPAYSAADLIGARDAIAVWQRETYGWMGRTPDYKASFMAQLADGEELYAPYHANALAWYHRTRRRRCSSTTCSWTRPSTGPTPATRCATCS